MKKGLTIFIVLFLFVTASVLWADLVYDTAVPESRFSYSIGAKCSLEAFTFETRKETSYYEGHYSNVIFGLFYQAEWKYFVMKIAPVCHFDFFSAYPNAGEDMQYKNGFGIESFGFDLNFLFRLPLVNRNFTLAFMAGPEADLEFFGIYGLGLNALLGLDMGFKVTEHHYLFLSFSAGMPIITTNGWQNFIGLSSNWDYVFAREGFDYVRSQGWPLKLELSLGLRTRIIDYTYYYKGKEVGRGK